MPKSHISRNSGKEFKASKRLAGKHHVVTNKDHKLGARFIQYISKQSEQYWQRRFKEFVKLRNPRAIEELESSLRIFFAEQIQDLPKNIDDEVRAQKILVISKAIIPIAFLMLNSSLTATNSDSEFSRQIAASDMVFKASQMALSAMEDGIDKKTTASFLVKTDAQPVVMDDEKQLNRKHYRYALDAIMKHDMIEEEGMNLVAFDAIINHDEIEKKEGITIEYYQSALDAIEKQQFSEAENYITRGNELYYYLSLQKNQELENIKKHQDNLIKSCKTAIEKIKDAHISGSIWDIVNLIRSLDELYITRSDYQSSFKESLDFIRFIKKELTNTHDQSKIERLKIILQIAHRHLGISISKAYNDESFDKNDLNKMVKELDHQEIKSLLDYQSIGNLTPIQFLGIVIDDNPENQEMRSLAKKYLLHLGGSKSYAIKGFIMNILEISYLYSKEIITVLAGIATFELYKHGFINEYNIVFDETKHDDKEPHIEELVTKLVDNLKSYEDEDGGMRAFTVALKKLSLESTNKFLNYVLTDKVPEEEIDKMESESGLNKGDLEAIKLMAGRIKKFIQDNLTDNKVDTKIPNPSLRDAAVRYIKKLRSDDIVETSREA